MNGWATARRQVLCWAALMLVAGAAGAGCATEHVAPRSTLELGVGYSHIATTRGEVAHQQVGFNAHVDHHSNQGFVAGLSLGLLEGHPDEELGQPSRSYMLASVGPYFGFEGRTIGMEFGIGLYAGGNSDGMRLLPIPWVVFRAGRLQTAWFEVITGAVRGVWDGQIASIGGATLFGQRKEFLFRAGLSAVLRLAQRNGRNDGLEFMDSELPLGGFAELRWTGVDGVGFYGRVVAAQQPSVVLGIALDLEMLGGATH